MLRREFTLVLVAVQFLTRVPVPSFTGFETSWLDRSTKYFPLVGLLVGSVAAAVLLGASRLWPSPLPALLAIAVAIALTGAFHEDGLADAADGLGGGLTRERRLEIMKDSRIGTYGAMALLVALSIKVAALASLEPWTAATALVAAHSGGRLMPVLAIAMLPYAGDAHAAKVKPLATGIEPREVAVAVCLAALPIAIASGTAGLLVSAAVAATAALLLALQSRRLIGGYTGDVLGAMEQVFEATFILAAAALLARS